MPLSCIYTSPRPLVGRGGQGLFRKPLHVPLARALDIPYYHLERAEVQSSHSVEGDIEEDQRPFEECVYRVGCPASAKSCFASGELPYLPRRGGPCAG